MFKRHFYWLFEEAGDPTDGGGAGGDGGDKGSKFDPDAFKAQVFKDFDAKLNGFAKNLKNEFSKMLKPGDGSGGDGGDAGGDGGQNDKGKSTGEVARLQRQLDQLNKTLADEKAARERTEAAARETTRKSALTAALNGIQFANDKAALAAFRLFDGEVKFNEAGEIVAGPDELPVAEFVKAQMREHEYLLAPKQTGGSGAAPGGKSGGKIPTLDDIKPGMKAEEIAAVAKHIVSVAGGQK